MISFKDIQRALSGDWARKFGCSAFLDQACFVPMKWTPCEYEFDTKGSATQSS